MEEAKKPGKAKRFFKRLAIAGVIALSYGMFYTHFDTSLIKGLSQKKTFVVGVDFEAYNKTEPLGILTNIPLKEKEDTTVPKTEKKKDDYDTQKKGEEAKKEDPKNLRDKEIENWDYVYPYTIMTWMSGTYSNALGFTPYYGNIYDKNKTKIVEKLEEGDETLEKIINEMSKSDIAIIRVRGDKKDYEYIGKDDPLTFITQRLVRKVGDYDYKMIVELEAPDDGDYEAHNKRIAFIKKMNPKLRVATTLDKKESYDEKTGFWDPEKGRKYWENADIIILEDYFSKPSDLEKSIKSFKETTLGGKQIWVRVVVGSERINAMGMESLDAEVEQYERLLEVVKEHADGVLANDTNGIWLYSDEAYDKGERLNRTRLLYKRFRRIKIERT